MQISENNAYLAFHYCPGIGPKTFNTILKIFGTAAKAWESPSSEWIKYHFPQKVIDAYAKHHQEFNLESCLANIKKLDIRYICRIDEDFPQLLLEIADCPIGLFVKGKLSPKDALAIAVVGTRNVTNYGREVTEKFVSQLVENGLTIVSGLARGVDGIAHRVVVENGGRTLAVLGSGLDIIYPYEHKNLAQQILGKGALISEYPPGTKPMAGNFPARNRIISGMSKGVLVTEGAQKSGSKITALMALEQNREVFAVPGPVTSSMSVAPAELIQMGAKLVWRVDDILDELGFEKKSQDGVENDLTELTESQRAIWKALVNGNQHIDALVRQLQLPSSQVMSELTIMELSGFVKHLGDGVWMVM